MVHCSPESLCTKHWSLLLLFIVHCYSFVLCKVIVYCNHCSLLFLFLVYCYCNVFALKLFLVTIFLCCLLHCFTYHCYCSFILGSCSFILGSLCTVIYTLHESWIYFFIVNTEYCAVLEYCCNWRPEVPTVQPRSVLTHTRSHKQPLITHTLSLSHSHTCGRAGWRAACAVCRSAWVS